MITILSRNIEDAGWWRGELNGKQGVFPDNFVKVIIIKYLLLESICTIVLLAQT